MIVSKDPSGIDAEKFKNKPADCIEDEIKADDLAVELLFFIPPIQKKKKEKIKCRFIKLRGMDFDAVHRDRPRKIAGLARAAAV